jgi:hypothetical protein
MARRQSRERAAIEGQTGDGHGFALCTITASSVTIPRRFPDAFADGRHPVLLRP